MQLQLDDVALFVRIVELGTLSAAAREREAPVSQVTRSLARLEGIEQAPGVGEEGIALVGEAQAARGACGARLLHRPAQALR